MATAVISGFFLRMRAVASTSPSDRVRDRAAERGADTFRFRMGMGQPRFLENA
jgi:hypothetical protein